MGPTSTLKSPLLLTDTCIVLHAHRLGVWKSLIHNRRICVPETVVGETICKAREKEFDDITVDLEKEIKQHLVYSPSLLASELMIVRDTCGPAFRGVWDSGEEECVACLLHEKYGCSHVCSSDAVVFRYLGWVQQGDRGVSFEEVLEGFGTRRKLLKQLTKKFRTDWTNRGFQEAFQSGAIELR